MTKTIVVALVTAIVKALSCVFGVCSCCYKKGKEETHEAEKDVS